MKKLIVLGIIVMMITACSVAANAYAGVALNLTAFPSNASLGSYHTVTAGWLTNDGQGVATTNGADWMDGTDGVTPMEGQFAVDIVDSLIGSTKVVRDYKAPVVASTDFQVWRLKAYTPQNDDHIGSTFYFAADFTPGLLPTNTAFYLFDIGGTSLTQAQADAAIGTSAQVFALDAKNAAAGYNGITTKTWTLAAPVYNADDDTWSANPTKTFWLYAKTVSVPEPGSMLAMFSGFVGLLGFGIRRRK